MKQGNVYHWDRVSDMPQYFANKARAAGMWNDDVDHIWFVKTGRRKPVEIDIVAKRISVVEFIIDDGKIYVAYHS